MVPIFTTYQHENSACFDYLKNLLFKGFKIKHMQFDMVIFTYFVEDPWGQIILYKTFEILSPELSTYKT